MKHFLAILLSVFFSIRIVAADKLTVQFADLKEMVESKNERVLSKDQELQAAEKRQGALLRSYLPDIELQVSQETFQKGTSSQKAQPTYGAEARINLFNGGRDSLLNRKNKIASERLKFEKQATVSEQTSHARELFWESLFFKEQIDLIKEAQQLNKKNILAANRRISSGVATQSDRIDFEMKDTELKQELAKSEFQLNNNIRLLAVVLGVSEDTELVLNQPFEHEHEWEAVLKHSHAEHGFLVKPSELKAEEMQIEADSLSRSYWPQIDAYAGWKQLNQREEDFPDAADRQETIFGVRMIIPIGSGLKWRNEGQAQQAEAQALKTEARFLQRELDAHLRAELAELKYLHNQVHDAELNIKKAENYYSITQSEYVRGVKNSPDVLGATEKFFDIKLKHLEIIKNFQISKSHVLSKIGK